jgi:hypothetical protein
MKISKPIKKYRFISVIAIASSLLISKFAFAEAGAKAMFADEGSTVMMNESTPSPVKTQKPKPAINNKHQPIDNLENESDNPTNFQAVSNMGNYSGLQYWIDLQEANGKSHRVTTNHIFHSGDRIKLEIRAKTSGHLYVLNEDSTGQTTPLYPTKGRNSYVEAGITYSIPERGAIRFDNVAGKEKVTIALSKYSINELKNSAVTSPNPMIPVSNSCSDSVGSKGMYTEESSTCTESVTKKISYDDCASNSAGSKGMFAEEGENIDMNCLRDNHSAGGAGSKGMFTEEDTNSDQPASYSVIPTSYLDQGQVLFVDFYLTHH